VTRLLLDTNVVLRWLTQDSLAEPVTSRLADGSNEAYVSIASAWEIAIKTSIGKLRPPEDFADAAEREGFTLLPIVVEHTRAVRDLPLHHRDPFDRMLVAQAQVEGLVLVTRDRRLMEYDVRVMDA
jgi:PIN domain nuclease of toxin-antitoxin system